MTLDAIIIYTKRPTEMVAFYTTMFDYEVATTPGDRLTQLLSRSGGLTLLLHPAAKGQKEGQVQVKLVFAVEDVTLARARLLESGVPIGPVHQADGYAFANLKDPAGNSVSISSRTFRPPCR